MTYSSSFQHSYLHLHVKTCFSLSGFDSFRIGLLSGVPVAKLQNLVDFEIPRMRPGRDGNAPGANRFASKTH